MRNRVKAMFSGEADDKPGNDVNVVGQQAAAARRKTKGIRGTSPCDTLRLRPVTPHPTRHLPCLLLLEG